MKRLVFILLFGFILFEITASANIMKFDEGKLYRSSHRNDVAKSNTKYIDSFRKENIIKEGELYRHSNYSYSSKNKDDVDYSSLFFVFDGLVALLMIFFYAALLEQFTSNK